MAAWLACFLCPAGDPLPRIAAVCPWERLQMSSKHRVPLRRDGPPITAVRPGPQHPRIAFGDLRCIDGSWWASTSEFKAGRSRQPLCLAKVHWQPPLPHIPCSQIGSAEALRIQDLHSARSSSALCLRSCCHVPLSIPWYGAD